VGYLYWIHVLREQGNWSQVAAVCVEALGQASLERHRLQVARTLVKAARTVGDRPALVTGLREAFRAEPTGKRLCRLLHFAKEGRERELSSALDLLSGDRELRRLHTAALLVAGRLAQAWELPGRRTESAGWSFDVTGTALLFSGVLLALCAPRAAQAVSARSLLDRYCGEDGYAEASGDDDEKSRSPELAELVARGLATVSLSPEQATQYEQWAVALTRKRVEIIVGGNHRKAYDRAAAVLAATAECLAIRGKTDAARALLAHYRDDLYRRRPAFRAELQAAVAGAPILTAAPEEGAVMTGPRPRKR
jgi:hypothetical protein